MSLQDTNGMYYDAETGLGGVDKLYRAAKQHGYSRKQVQVFLKKQYLNQVFRPAVQKKRFFPIWCAPSMARTLET